MSREFRKGVIERLKEKYNDFDNMTESDIHRVSLSLKVLSEEVANDTSEPDFADKEREDSGN